MTETKKKFRNEIKNMTLDYLRTKLQNVQREIEKNKYEFKRIHSKQNELKKERGELQRMITEYIK